MNEGIILNCSMTLCWNSSQDILSPVMNDTVLEYYYIDQDVSFWQVPQLAVLIGLFIFIVFGNTGVLIAIALSETGLKTRMNFFIVNLAVADLTVGLFHVTVDLAERCLVVWHGGSAMCKIVRFLQVLVVYASTFMIVSLSIDRVDAIARPMNFTRKATTIRALVNAAWILSGVLAIPSFVLFDTVQLNNETHCIMTLQEPWHWRLYVTLAALTAFVIPAIIIIVCYSIIIFVIWDKGRGFSSAFQPPSCRNLTSYSDMPCGKQEILVSLRRHSGGHQPINGGNKGIIPQAKIRTLKMTLIIVCVFVFSWCPYFVFNLMDVYGDNSTKSMTQYAVTALIQSLAPLNSAANPIIYGLFGTRIFNGLRRIPCFLFCFERSCRCRIKRNLLQHRNSRYQTEQTYIDATSGRLVPFLKRTNQYHGRHLVRYDTSVAGGFSQSTTNTSSPHSLQTFVSGGNGVCKNISCSSKMCSENSKDSECLKKCVFHRRSSGLPIVNRKITEQESILLETFRPKFDKNGKNGYEKVCRDEADTKNLLLPETIERFQRISEVSMENSLQE